MVPLDFEMKLISGTTLRRLRRELLDVCVSQRKAGYHEGILCFIVSFFAEFDLTIGREGDLAIIRPFVYIRELQTKRYAKWNNLPVITENCPACFSEPKERRRIKILLAAQENMFPDLFKILRATLHPLMHGR